ncbi:unnamed protein product [Coffea canephora]|uniref:DH200=94 genomic scaffold, scaffold_920 n=1 Tax=Coffea canephora TaxID=49390 RepID=A0A068VKC3_COFCA|nr:unnamed protein product [Coffea canephora]
MAEFFVPKIIGVLGDVALKQLGRKINLVMGIEEEVENIKKSLETIEKVLHDAERRRLKERPVGKWLEELEDIAYEMDDVLDEWTVKIQKLENEGTHQNARLQPILWIKVRSLILSLCSCLKQLPVRSDNAQKIKGINEKLELTLKEADQFKFITRGGIPDSQDFQRIITTSMTDESKICGRESDKVALLDQVLSKSRAGGSGKTTLAQLLFNDDEVKDHFELKKWVCVSDPFDQKRIAKAVLEGPEKSSLGSLELETLLQLLKETFSGKRFLLVLDDVWTKDDSKWEPFQDSLKDGALGSMALMSDSDCWLIMQRIAFAKNSGDLELCKKVERIGQKIAEKCKGLPLAAKTMGSLLRFKDTVQQWQNVLDSEIWQLEEAAVELFPHLYLSYNELSPELKRCFSHCAVFPKDHEIVVEELLRLWIAQGYVRPRRRGERLELVGLEYFNSLAMRSFFQELEKAEALYGLPEYMKCKMHDIVHDFAQFLTKNECHALDGIGRNSCSERARHLTILKGTEEEVFSSQDTNDLRQIPQGLGKLTSLCTLSRFIARSNSDDLAILKNLNQLERLVIEIDGEVDFGSAKLDKKINMREMFLLFSDGTHFIETPSCIETMEPPPNLELLGLTGYPGAQLPSWFVTKSHANNLTRLIIDSPRNVSSLPTLWKLSSLEELEFVGAEKLECLGKEFFGSSSSAEAVAFPNLRKLHFRHFQNWTNWEDLSEDDEEVAVSIMPRLEELKISHCYELEALPHRILSKISSLKKLDIRSCDKTLTLSYCELAEIPAEIGSLIHFRHLDLSWNPFVTLSEAICDLYYLETLDIRFCEKLSCLPERIEGFVHLRHLFNHGTSELRQIPQGLGKLTSLCTLTRFITRSNFDDLSILKDLNQLEILRVVIEGEVDFGSAELEKKINLREMDLCFRLGAHFIETPSCIETMEPPPNLQRLWLDGYPGARLPSWLLTKCHANNLTRLSISGPCNISSLLALWKLSSLEELVLLRVEKLEYLGKEFFGVAKALHDNSRDALDTLSNSESSSSAEAIAFPNLKKLYFGYLTNWTNWEDLSKDDEEVAVSIMPSLEELKIKDCKELEALPHRILSKISSLKNLNIRCCNKLRDRYSDKTRDDWIKISRIPRVDISDKD